MTTTTYREGRALALAAALLVTMASPAAHAEERPPVRRVWLDARPWTCTGELPAFAGNVELACDAMGRGCEVAATEGEATETATLFCDPRAPWSVELERGEAGRGRSEGEKLVVTLAGDREQRLRRAAMWVAHASLDPSMSRVSPTPPTPPVAPVAPVAPAEAAAPDPSTEAPPVLILTPAPDHDTVKAAHASGRGGVTFSALAGLTVNAGAAAGFRAGAAIPLRYGFYIGPNVSYLSFYPTTWPGPTAGFSADDGQGVFADASVGWGAPFDDHWVGFALGGGGGGTWGNGTVSSPAFVPAGYGRAAVTLQVPLLDWPVRPTVTLSAAQLGYNQTMSGMLASLEVGLAWRAF